MTAVREDSPGVTGTGFWAAALLVFIAAFAVYAPTVGYDFVWDDELLLGNIKKQGAKGLGALLSSEFVLQEPTGYYRPLVQLSLWLENVVSGGSPALHHFVNVVVHSLSSLLLYLLLFFSGFGVFASAAGALWFSLNPVHVEAVAFISGRTDLLAGFFLLASLTSFVFVLGRQGPLYMFGIAASGLLLFFGALSKEVALVCPLVPVAFVFGEKVFGATPLGKLEARDKAAWLAAWGLAVLAALGVRFLFASVPFGTYADMENVRELSAGGGAGLAALMFAEYLKLLFFPWVHNSYYVPSDLKPGLMLFACALAMLSFFVAAARKRFSYSGFFGLFVFVLFLLPVSGLVPLKGALLAERFLYLPALGAALAAASLWAGFGLERKPMVVVAAVLFLLSLGGGVLAQARSWESNETLFARMVKQSPEVPFVHNNYGSALFRKGEFARAEEAFRRAVSLDPQYEEALANLGNALLEKGDYTGAFNAYSKALAAGVDRSLAVGNMGYAKYAAGDYRGALALYGEALALAPGNPEYLYSLGNCKRELGDYPAAEKYYEQTISADPGYRSAYKNLGLMRLQASRFDEALSVFEAMSIRFPGDAEALMGKGLSHYYSGNLLGAEKVFKDILAGAPGYKPALSKLNEVERALGRRHE